MTDRFKRFASGGAVVLMALAVALAFGAAPAAATSHVDTLAGDGTDVVQNFNASDDRFIEYTLDADDQTNGFDGDGSTVLKMNVTHNGEEHASASNSTFDGTALSYTFNISQDELATVPGEANSSTTVTVNAWGEDDGGNVTTSLDSFNATLEYQDGYAVVYIGDAEVAGDTTDITVNADSPEGIFATLGVSDPTYNVEADNVGLGQNASGTTVHIVAANQTDSDAFSEADSKLFGSYEAQDFHSDHLLEVQGHTHAVFVEEAPVDDLADGYTYATVGERNGHDAYSVHIADDYSGESSVDVSTTANDGPRVSFLVKRDAYGGYTDALTASTMVSGGLTAGA